MSAAIVVEDKTQFADYTGFGARTLQPAYSDNSLGHSSYLKPHDPGCAQYQGSVGAFKENTTMQMQGKGANDPGLDNPDPGSHCPAIWLYPKKEMDVELTLKFHGAGFMTTSAPSYNDRWRIHVDPTKPFNRFSSTYVDDPWVPHLDYDGFRDGEFQRAEGWLVEQQQLLSWQRSTLAELGFLAAEIDEANIDYGRMLLNRQYKERYFTVYPQTTKAVDASVSLTVDPAPDTVYRLWLLFVPTDRPPPIKTPRVEKIERHGFTLIELAYLTEREIPTAKPEKQTSRERPLWGHRAGVTSKT